MKKNLGKQIFVGKFYFVHDGTKTGHPGLIVWKDDEANRYLVVRFDSDKWSDVPKSDRGVRHITRLLKTINPLVKNSYIHNRPMLCKRKDIGGEMVGLSIQKEDLSKIEKASKMNPEMAPSLRKNKK